MSETIEVVGANADQIKYWNSSSGRAWVTFNDLLDQQLEPLGRSAVQMANISSGEAALDIGCGCGATSIMLAEAGATVLGVDISRPMLDMAQERSSAAQLSPQPTFALGDAAMYPFPAEEYDLAFSRFGCMFFSDPVAAMRNIRGALKSSGRVCMLVWRGIADNPWMGAPMAAAMQYLPANEPADPKAPGPFAFADPDYVRNIFSEAGFVNIDIQPLDQQIAVGGNGGTPETAATFYTEIGPLSRLLSQVTDEVRNKVHSAVHEVLQAHVTDEGVRMGAGCWVISASIS